VSAQTHYGDSVCLDDVRPILDRIAILGGLTDAQVARVFDLFEHVAYSKGERVFEEGTSPSHIYVVLSGRVKIVADIDRNPLELVAFESGKCFGETSAIGIEPHSATAVAVEDTCLMALPGRALHALYKDDPGLFGLLLLNIAREACRRLHRTDELLLHYAMQSESRKG
jgi:CRP-like cAMP-binding protein